MEIQPWDQLNLADQQTIRKAIQEVHPNHNQSVSLPQDWVAPRSVSELTGVLEESVARQYRLLTMGAGSKLGWGGLVSHCDRVICTRHLHRLVDHAVSDLTVTAEAGMKLRDLQNILEPHHQFLPIDPAYPDQATLGGIMATADSGSWRQRYGGLRDLVLGFSFARWDGQIAKAGSRVVKNVAGYDLMKLFAGSYGTLGIITQITFRLYPLPPTSQTLWLSGETDCVAIAAQQLLKSGLAPTMADVLSPALAEILGLGSQLGLLVRFQNIPESVTEQVEQLANLAKTISLTQTVFNDEQELLLWQQLQRQMTEVTNAENIHCKLGIQPSQAVNFFQQIPGFGQIHLNTGLGRLLIPAQANTAQILAQLTQQRQLCQRDRGFLTILEAPPSIKSKIDVWGYNGNGLESMKQIKEKFDPHRLFSPGRFVGGL